MTKQEQRVPNDAVKKAIAEARRIAPKIEEALSEVRDAGMRAAMGAKLLGLLVGVSENYQTARRVSVAHAVRRRERGRGTEKGGTGLVGTQARIIELSEDGFFSRPRSAEEVREDLRMRGFHHNRADIRMSLLRLARKKLLKRIASDEKAKSFEYVKS